MNLHEVMQALGIVGGLGRAQWAEISDAANGVCFDKAGLHSGSVVPGSWDC